MEECTCTKHVLLLLLYECEMTVTKTL